MATLQKFKLLATQCAVAGSPTRSPTTSPVIHLRRRKTLRMFLSRRRPDDDDSPDRRDCPGDSPEKGNEMVVASHKLKDLFVSSPPCEDRVSGNEELGFLPGTGCSGDGRGSTGRRWGPRSLRPLTASFRQRLLRRHWRPVLVTIPE